MVPERLKVDPIDLHMSADQMSAHHADLRATHAAADSDIQGAQSGWVGVSAAALQAKLAEWQSTTEQLCGTIASHERAFRAARDRYRAVDGESAAVIDDQV